MLKDIKRQAPKAVCDHARQRKPQPANQPGMPPFDNLDVRRAMALTLDRQAFIDIISKATATSAAVMLPPPEASGACRPKC